MKEHKMVLPLDISTDGKDPVLGRVVGEANNLGLKGERIIEWEHLIDVIKNKVIVTFRTEEVEVKT